jgi:nucleoside-diphosphate-sugar epimerase
LQVSTRWSTPPAYLPASYADSGEARKLLEVNALGTLAVLESCVRTLVRKAVVFKPITVKDGGRYRSDFVFVGDVVDATERALLRDVHGSFNVGSGTTSSSLEIAEALVALTGASRDLLIVEPPASGAILYGFAPLDVTRAREQLGYAPRTVKDALGVYVDWYRSRP